MIMTCARRRLHERDCMAGVADLQSMLHQGINITGREVLKLALQISLCSLHK